MRWRPAIRVTETGYVAGMMYGTGGNVLDGPRASTAPDGVWLPDRAPTFEESEAARPFLELATRLGLETAYDGKGRKWTFTRWTTAGQSIRPWEHLHRQAGAYNGDQPICDTCSRSFEPRGIFGDWHGAFGDIDNETRFTNDDLPSFGQQFATKGGPIDSDIERRIIERGG